MTEESGIERFIRKPDMTTPIDESQDELTFGRGTLVENTRMPGITIDGRSYTVAYEQMSPEALQGIPLRKDDRVIGIVDMNHFGEGKVTLNPGETLDIDESSTVTYSIGNLAMFGTDLEVMMLDQVNQGFRKILNFKDALEDESSVE